MKTFKLEKSIELLIPIEKAWSFFSNPNNLSNIMPATMQFKVISGANLPLQKGQIIKYEVSPLPLYKTNWISEITEIKKPYFFEDIQLEGPYKLWSHKHYLKETSKGTRIIDIIHYQVPFGVLGRLLHPIIIKPKLEAIFRHRTIKIKESFSQK